MSDGLQCKSLRLRQFIIHELKTVLFRVSKRSVTCHALFSEREVDTGITYTEFLKWVSPPIVSVVNQRLRRRFPWQQWSSQWLLLTSWTQEMCCLLSWHHIFFPTLVVYDDCLKKTQKTKKNNLDLFKEISHYNVEKVRTGKNKVHVWDQDLKWAPCFC